MEFTQEQLVSAGYNIKAAPRDSWRDYDEHNPIPGYFEFDWLSARHPDLYHKFALSTVGLMIELDKIVDLAGLEVADIGAGTGRATIEAAKKAKKVTAIDVFESVIPFGRKMVAQAGLGNVEYIRAHSANLPLADRSMDACIGAWAVLDYPEACRVLKPGGYILELGAPLNALCGEFTATLADVYPEVITAVAPADWYVAGCPDSDHVLDESSWNGLPVIPPTLEHDFTYTADYGDAQEAAAILGRLYGPAARQYLLERRQATLSWRLRITVIRVRK